MAITYNTCSVLGYAGRDAEYFENAGCASVSIATSEKPKNGDTITTWFRVVCWGDQGKDFARVVRKGNLLSVTGRLRDSTYTDRNDVERTVKELHVQRWSCIEEVKRERRDDRDRDRDRDDRRQR